jgi:hypothetical protein
MARQLQRSREQIEDELLAFELTERRCFLILTIVLYALAVVFAVLGEHWPVPSVPGVLGTASAYTAHRRPRG